jgi:glycosyltransferase involved in cell wall biosynthesis
MKILHVISGIAPRAGGPSTVLRSLARAQAAAGHQVAVCTTNQNYPSGSLDVPTASPVLDQGVATWYHAMDVRALYFSRSLGAWLLKNIDDYDVVHVHGLYRFPPTFAASLARVKRVPYMIRPHGSLDPFMYKQSRYSLPLKRLYERLFDLPNLNHAGAIHYTSDDEAHRAAVLGLKAPAVVVSNGLEWAEYAELPHRGRFRQRLGLGADQALVLFLGRLNFKKGLDLLIPAFADVIKRVPSAALAVVGPDNEGFGAQVHRWCAEHGLNEHVHFVDHIPPQETREAYVDADLFALTSYTENTGMTAVEAMACACPVVVSDQVNIWPAIQEAAAGIVVPLERAPIGDALVRVLEDPALGARMGRAGRLLAKKQFSWGPIVAQLDGVYAALIRREAARVDSSP